MHARANEIVAAAHEYIGVPFRHQGRTRAGLDCAGLVVRVAHDLGLTSHDNASYGKRPNVPEFTDTMVRAGCTRLPYGGHEHGDILRFAIEGHPVHIGIYEIDEAGDEWVIHGYAPRRKVVRERLTKELKDKISTVWRYPA